MNNRLMAYATRQAPRYTSYPAAPHFSAEVGHYRFNEWLAAQDANATLSLYLHVPYCRQLCWYCGCNTFAARRDETLEDFVDTLAAEIRLVGDALSGQPLIEIHWGGGTPNILSVRQFERIVEQMALSFGADRCTRHAIELDPRYVDEEKADAYAKAGVNRASLGVQDLNDRVQQAIGRVQPADIVHRAVTILRDAGIRQVNMDLMYGLPHQTTADVLHSLKLASAMKPDRIALFGYAHVPWFKKRQRLIPEAALPSPAERFDQAEAAREQLLTLGYVAVGLDHFALPDDELVAAQRTGALGRSFQGYVIENATTLVGVGPSAISTLPQGYAQNVSEVGAWTQAIRDGHLAIVRGHALTDEDRIRRQLIEQIMCDFEGNLALVGGAAACGEELTSLAAMFADDMIRLEGDRLILNDQARPFCRLVAMAFDIYAGRGAARHSRAV